MPHMGERARVAPRPAPPAAARVFWKAERFSRWFTSLMHRFPETGEFDTRMQIAKLEYLCSSTAAQTGLAENHVGLSLVT